ncbi:MAG: hypothetical protein JNJ60_18235 [Rhodocyclaceae bacterium]|nr:hypothetical protein [Rhodocyclaceae bacterium]
MISDLAVPIKAPAHASEARGARWRFVLVDAAALLFVLWSGAALPDITATHFGGSGYADGWMARHHYLAIMGGLVLALPMLVAFVPLVGRSGKSPRVNVPNREYWLAGPRRAATLAWLGCHMARCATLTALFLAVMHWLVMRANQNVPAYLDTAPFIAALIGFVLALAIWASALSRHFRLPPRA